MNTAVVLTGYCPHCSWGERIVVHGTAWCPVFPALCYVDWNACRRDEAGEYHDLIGDDSFNRPVAVGEIVVLFCRDGDDMITWGRVEMRRERRVVREVCQTICNAPTQYDAPTTDGR